MRLSLFRLKHYIRKAIGFLARRKLKRATGVYELLHDCCERNLQQSRRFNGKAYTIVILLSLLVFVTACSRETIVYSDPQAEAYVRRDAMLNYITQQLAKNGVQLIVIGEDFLIIIPSDRLFYPQSPMIYWSSYNLLNDVITYLKFFKKITIKVAGYTSSLGSEKRNYALSLARARNVANYLWSQDIDTRVSFVRGYGSNRPMYSGDTLNKQNERIEIMFRDP